MRWFSVLIGVWLAWLILLWIVGADGVWMIWVSRAVGGVIVVAFVWTFLLRTGPDD